MAKPSPKGERIHSCFIAAPAGIELSVLRSLLSERRISAVVAADIPVGASIHEGIRNAIVKSDLVIAVMPTEERGVANVAFELGVATGSNRTTILIAGKSTEPLPSDLTGIPIIRADPDDVEAIRFHLDQLLASPMAPRAARGPIRPGPILGKRATEFLAKLPAEPGPGVEKALESLVRELLAAAGAESVGKSEAKGIAGGRPDIALWSDGLSAITGNPLIVEIKTDLHVPAAAARAETQLVDYVASAGTQWGLLLYLWGPDQIPDAPPVIHFRIDQLIEELRSAPFADAIRRKRNLAVHSSRVE